MDDRMDQMLKKLREVCQSWSKQAVASNGQLSVNIATEICLELVSATSISEQVYKTLAYPLSNCRKMFEKAALDLLEGFGKVIIIELNLRSNSSNIDKNKYSNREAFAKGVSNFIQASTQVAAKFNSKATPNKDATTCVRIAQILTIATHPRTMNMIHAALKPEQVVGLANYVLDVALNFTVNIDADATGQTIATTLASKSTQSPVSGFLYKHMLEKGEGARAKNANGGLLYALRTQVLEVVVNEMERGVLCTYSVARAFDLLTKHLAAVCKACNKSPSTTTWAELAHNTAHLGAGFLVLWLDMLKRALATEEKGQRIKKSSGVQAQDLLRAVLWLHELEASFKASPGLRSNKLLPALTRRAWQSVRQQVEATTSPPDELGILAKALVLMQPGSEDVFATKSLCYSVYAHKQGRLSAQWLSDSALLEASNKLCSCLLLKEGSDENTNDSLYGEVLHRYAAAMEAALTTVDAETLKAKSPAGPRMLARCHVESLNTVSALLRANKADKRAIETTKGHNMALCASVSALRALGRARLWEGPAMSSHAAVLRATGNCLSQVPRGAFELWLGGGNLNRRSEVVALLESLSACVVSLSTSEETLTLVDSLVYLVSSRYSAALSVLDAGDIEGELDKATVYLLGFQLNTHMVALAALNTAVLDYKQWHRAALGSATMAVFALCCSAGETGPKSEGQSILEVLIDSISVMREKVDTAYAAEFASVLSNVLLSRAGSIVSSASMSSTDDCMALLTEAIKSSHPSVARCLELSVSSAFCWASGIGPSDALASTIIEGLKGLAMGLDHESCPSVEMVARKTKGRAGAKDWGRKQGEQKESTAVPLVVYSGADYSISSDSEDQSKPFLQTQRAALLLHLWVVLAQWSLPSSTSSEDHATSDGQVGQHVYLSNATKALHRIVHSVQEVVETVDTLKSTKDGCEAALLPKEMPSMCSLVHTLLDDSKALFSLLGLNGRRKHQEEVAQAVATVCKDFTALIDLDTTPSLRSMRSFASALFPAGSDLRVLQRLLLLWDGHNEVDQQVQADIKRSDNNHWGTNASLFLDQAAIVLRSGKGKPTQFESLEKAAQATVDALSSHISGLGSTSTNPQFYHVLRAWTALLSAKITMTVQADLHAAIRWTKRALGMLSHQQMGVASPVTGGTTLVSLDACVPRLEAVLLVADLFEQAGHIESALTYTSEAVSIAKVSPRAINSIVLLHSLRIWYRAGSLRLISCVSDLLNDEFELGLPEEKKDDVTSSVRAATKCLAKLLDLGIDPEVASKDTPASVPSLESIQETLQYRHTRCMWNLQALITSQRTSKPAGNTSHGEEENQTYDPHCYHTCLQEDKREDVYRELLRVDSAAAPDSSLPLVSGVSASSHPGKKEKTTTKEDARRTAISVLNSLSDSYSFDVLRDLRRRACVQITTTGRVDTDDMLSFVLGASSCSTSLECMLESEHFSSSFGTGLERDPATAGSRERDPATAGSRERDPATAGSRERDPATAGSSGRGPYAHLSSVSHLVRRACTADTAALAHVEATLKTALMHMGQNASRSATASPAAAVCVVTLERTSGKLILGRYDGTRSRVVALPVLSQVNQVLEDLESALASSKASLLRTMDAEAVGKWSDDDKREWWKERKDGDKAVKDLLKSLETSLGAWKYLLCADSADVEVLMDPTRFDFVQDRGQPSLAPVSGWLSLLLKGVQEDEDEDPTDCIVALLKQFDSCIEAESKAQRIVTEERARIASKPSSLLPPPPVTAEVEEEKYSVEALSGAFEDMKVTDLRKRLREEGLPTEGLKSELVSRLKQVTGTAATPARSTSKDKSSGTRSAMKTPGQKGAKTPSRKKLAVFCEEEEEKCAIAAGRQLKHKTLPPPPSVHKAKAKKTISFDDTVDRTEDLTGANDETDSANTSVKGGHTLLILDERLQALPWESMPCLRGRQCSRVPSLALLMSMSYDLFLGQKAKTDIHAFLEERRRAEIEHLNGSDRGRGGEDLENVNPRDENASTSSQSAIKKSTTQCVSPLRSPVRKSKTPVKAPPATVTTSEKFLDLRVSLSRSWYVIDPECNLPHTRATMSAFLEPYAKQYDWHGAVAAVPAEDKVKGQHNKSQLFIFCGHGAGEKVCDVQLLKKSHCPAAMLWGCSSGRLALQGVHDPAGVALQYLIRGAPFVLGNLWDVTDKDIDKLSVACMSSLFDTRSLHGDERVAVAEALATSRAVCKMSYAVGCAPIMYGLPLSITE